MLLLSAVVREQFTEYDDPGSISEADETRWALTSGDAENDEYSEDAADKDGERKDAKNMQLFKESTEFY